MKKTKSADKLVYLIYSAHKLLLEDALQRLINSLGADDAVAFNVSKFSAGEDDIDKILGACQALSFLGGVRFVIVQNILKLDKAGEKTLVDYLRNPNPQTVLVMTETTGSKEDARNLKASEIFRQCTAVKSAGVHEYALKSGLPAWVKTTFGALGKKVGLGVAEYLVTWVGPDLGRLKSEIAKISDSTEAAEITIDIVKNVAVVVHEAAVYDLVNAVIDHDIETALTTLAPLLESDNSGRHVFGLLERQFQLIFKAKTKGRGLSRQKMASALRVGSGQAYFLEKQSRVFSLSGAKTALGLLVEADYVRKSSSIPIRLLLETLIVDLAAIR